MPTIKQASTLQSERKAMEACGTYAAWLSLWEVARDMPEQSEAFKTLMLAMRDIRQAACLQYGRDMRPWRVCDCGDTDGERYHVLNTRTDETDSGWRDAGEAMHRAYMLNTGV